MVENLYRRATDLDFDRGSFRVKGDTVEIFLAYADYGIRIEFWGDEIERISAFEPETGIVIETYDEINIYPANIFVSSPENTKRAVDLIFEDMVLQVENFKNENKIFEAKRLEERVSYDLETVSYTHLTLPTKRIV